MLIHPAVIMNNSLLIQNVWFGVTVVSKFIPVKMPWDPSVYYQYHLLWGACSQLGEEDRREKGEKRVKR
jgi:hypothetical protein